MKSFTWLAFAALVCVIAAGCPEMTDDKPAANAPKVSSPPPPPPPPNVGAQAGADDDSVPVVEVDPKMFAKEQAAADELEKMGLLVIREGPEKVVTSVNFMGKGKSIDPKALDRIPDLFRVMTINFSDNAVGSEQLKAVQSSGELTSLLLGGTQVGDAGLKYLAGLRSLASLHLPRTKITDAGLPPLTTLPKLAILDLSDTKITDRGLPEIAKIEALNWLLISGTDISDEGLPALAGMPNLSRLSLLDTKVTEQGIAAIKAAKPKLHVDSGSRPK
jgi:Leucine-rich repeat (LRR) protein